MKKPKKKKAMRVFATGATRDNDNQKINIIGSFSPLVIKRFAEFMRDHNIKKGKLSRNEANWKKGMPSQSYMESHARHALDAWIEYEGYGSEDIEVLLDLLCADMFNTMGHIHNLLLNQLEDKRDLNLAKESLKRNKFTDFKNVKKELGLKSKKKPISQEAPCNSCKGDCFNCEHFTKKKNKKKKKVIHLISGINKKDTKSRCGLVNLPKERSTIYKRKMTCKTCKKSVNSIMNKFVEKPARQARY